MYAVLQTIVPIFVDFKKNLWYAWIFSFTVCLVCYCLFAVFFLRTTVCLFFSSLVSLKITETLWNPNHMYYFCVCCTFVLAFPKGALPSFHYSNCIFVVSTVQRKSNRLITGVTKKEIEKVQHSFRIKIVLGHIMVQLGGQTWSSFITFTHQLNDFVSSRMNW